MEFTFEGIVRQGFGFYNPNHAAALFCALFPLVWAAWFRWRNAAARALAGIAALVLIAALAATMSRTGLGVLAAEMAVLALWSRHDGRAWVAALALVACLALAFWAFGGWGRLGLDAAVENRFAVWKTGLQLAAANPGGVGLGQSGLLASLFMLPEGIVCRTLVQSHLTLLTEFGWLAGALWCGGIVYALCRRPAREGSRWSAWRFALWVSFVGLVVSGFASSVFDWPLLLDARAFGGLSPLNWTLSWGLLVLFAATGLVLSWGRVDRKAAACSFAAVSLLVVGLAALPAGEAPRVRGGMLVRGTAERALVLYGPGWTLARMLPLLPDACAVPLGSEWAGIEAEDAVLSSTGHDGTVWLFGEAAEWAKRFPKARLVLVSPPPYIPLPNNVERVYCRRFVETSMGPHTVFYDL